MEKQKSTKKLLIQTLSIFIGITIVGLIVEVGYDCFKGHSISQALDEWLAKNQRPSSLIIRLITSYAFAYFDIFRNKQKVSKQSKLE